MPADFVLHCFKTGYSIETGLLVKAEKLKGKMVTFLLYKKNIFLKFICNIALSGVSLAYHEMTSRYDTNIVRKRIVIQYNFSESLQLYIQIFSKYLKGDGSYMYGANKVYPIEVQTQTRSTGEQPFLYMTCCLDHGVLTQRLPNIIKISQSI